MPSAKRVQTIMSEDEDAEDELTSIGSLSSSSWGSNRKAESALAGTFQPLKLTMCAAIFTKNPVMAGETQFVCYSTYKCHRPGHKDLPRKAVVGALYMVQRSHQSYYNGTLASGITPNEYHTLQNDTKSRNCSDLEAYGARVLTKATTSPPVKPGESSAPCYQGKLKRPPPYMGMTTRSTGITTGVQFASPVAYVSAHTLNQKASPEASSTTPLSGASLNANQMQELLALRMQAQQMALSGQSAHSPAAPTDDTPPSFQERKQCNSKKSSKKSNKKSKKKGKKGVSREPSPPPSSSSSTSSSASSNSSANDSS
jgi:hypothetical protein